MNLRFAISAETIRDAIAKSSPTPTPNVDYLGRGTDERNKGNYEGAISNYTEAIRLEPDFVGAAYYGRGIVYFYLGQFDKAINDYTEDIRLKPDSSLTYRNRGMAYYSLKQFDKAINDLNEAIRLNPHDERSFGGRGRLFMDLKQYRKAVSDYTEAIRLFRPSLHPYPDANDFRGMTYCERGKAYFSLEQYSKALSDYKKAISDYTEAIQRLAPLKLEAYDNGFWPNALSDYKKAISVGRGPTWGELNCYGVLLASLYEKRAYVYDVIGDHSKAEQDRKKARELSNKQ